VSTADREEAKTGFDVAEATPKARHLGRLTEPLGILVGNPSLTTLLVAFAALTVAEWSYVTGLSVDAFRHHGSIAVGFVGFRLFFAAIGSFVGVPFLERHMGAGVLSAIAGIRAAIVTTTAALAAVGTSFTWLLVLVAVDAVISSPYRPAQAAMLPALARTPRELAASAVGLSTVKTLSQALGAMGGGLLLVVTSPSAVFAGAAGLLLSAAIVTTRFARVSVPSLQSSTSRGIRETIRSTFAVVREPHVDGLLVASGLRTFVRGMWTAMAVIASLKLLHAGSAGVGLLMLAAGIGSLAAVPVSAGLIDRSRIGTPAALALGACGLPLGVIAGFPVFGVAMALVAAWGIGMAVADVATLSLLYRLLDIPLLPRVTAAIESVKLALEGFGSLLAPALVAVFGIRGALVAAAVPLPLVVVAGWRMLHRLDSTAEQRTRVRSLLHGVECLEPLDMVSLESLAGGVVRVKVPEGAEVVRQGEDGDRFYVVDTGTADIVLDGYNVGVVTPGGSFGERALLRDVPRTATVRTRTSMELLALSREDFLTALTGHSDVGARTATPALRASSDWNRRDRAEALSRVSLLSHLDTSQLRELAVRSVVDTWPQGTVIIRQGDEGDRFFVLLSGRAAVAVGTEPASELHAGDQFGEIALLHGVPRSAEVTASSDVATLSLRRDDFVSAVRSRVLVG